MGSQGCRRPRPPLPFPGRWGLASPCHGRPDRKGRAAAQRRRGRCPGRAGRGLRWGGSARFRATVPFWEEEAPYAHPLSGAVKGHQKHQPEPNLRAGKWSAGETGALPAVNLVSPLNLYLRSRWITGVTQNSNHRNTTGGRKMAPGACQRPYMTALDMAGKVLRTARQGKAPEIPGPRIFH